MSAAERPGPVQHGGVRLDPVERAIADVAAGRAVVVVDDEDRENEGDLIFAAEKATPELLAFMVRYTSGYVCVSLTEEDCERLDLPPMYPVNQDKRRTAYGVTVDGVSLTVAAVGDDWFEVSLVPATLALTTLGAKGPGDPVNLEVDVMAKYVEKLLQAGAAPREDRP